jgi:signal peptidase I
MLRLFKIAGKSLEPRLYDGDFVLVAKVPFWLRPPRSGDVVVFRHPRFGVLIKRVQRISPHGELYVTGERPSSNDSDAFGVVETRDLIGKVVFAIKKKRPETTS